MDTSPSPNVNNLLHGRPTEAADTAASNLVRLGWHPVTEAIEDKLVADCNPVPNDTASDTLVPDIGPIHPQDADDAADDPMEMPTCIMGIEVDPVAGLIPGPSRRQYEALKKDIAIHGFIEPVKRVRGRWGDGRSRLMIGIELGITPTIVDLPDDTDTLALVMSANVHRRHLTKSQLAIFIVAAHEWVKSGYNQHSGGCAASAPPSTSQMMADLAGVSRTLVEEAKIVHKAGLDQEALSGPMPWKETLNKAKQILRSQENTNEEADLPSNQGAPRGEKPSAPSNAKNPKKKLPEDVVELQRLVRSHKDEINELATALNQEQATTKALRTERDQLRQKIAVLEGKANVPFAQELREQAVVNGPEFEEAVEVLSAVDETPVDVAVLDDVVLEGAAVEQPAMDEAVQDSEQAEALLGPPSPLKTYILGLIHAYPGHKKPDHLDPKRKQDDHVIEAEDIREIERRLQGCMNVTDGEREAYFAFLENYRLAAATPGHKVVQEQTSTLAMLPEAEVTVPVRTMAILDGVAPAAMSMSIESTEEWVATKLLAPGLESSVRVTEEAIDYAAYLGHTVALVKA